MVVEKRASKGWEVAAGRVNRGLDSLLYKLFMEAGFAS
jgi:hypothetical protein